MTLFLTCILLTVRVIGVTIQLISGEFISHTSVKIISFIAKCTRLTFNIALWTTHIVATIFNFWIAFSIWIDTIFNFWIAFCILINAIFNFWIAFRILIDTILNFWIAIN